MTTPANRTASFQVAPPGQIVRALPLDGAQASGGTRRDSPALLPTSLFGVDEGWFDAYWYGQQSDARRRLPGKLAGVLRDTIATVRGSFVLWTNREGATGRFRLAPLWR